MSELSEFFLSSPARVVLLDTLEISHPDFSQTYRLVRNAPNGIRVNQDGEVQWVFDGVNDEVSFGNVAALAKERTDAWTLIWWFSTTDATGFSTAVSKINSDGGSGFIGWQGYMFSTGEIGFQMSSGTLADRLDLQTDDGGFNDGELHQVVVTTDGSGTGAGTTVWVDGVQRTFDAFNDSLTGSIVSSDPVFIGKHGFDVNFCQGHLRHISVWSREFDQSDVDESYNDGLPPDLLATSMAGDLDWWVKLDEEDESGSGGIVDHSGGGNNGTANFSPTTGEGPADYDYCPMRVLPIASGEDMVQALSITLGDVGDIIAEEIGNLWEANGMGTRPTITYRGYRSDDLETPIRGPIELEMATVTRSKDGCAFEARAPETNASRTGELYTPERFPTLRGFT